MKLLITLYKRHQSSWKQKKKTSVSQTRHDEGLMNLGPKLPDEESPCEEESQETN